jgi:hypothetical protein
MTYVRAYQIMQNLVLLRVERLASKIRFISSVSWYEIPGLLNTVTLTGLMSQVHANLHWTLQVTGN